MPYAIKENGSYRAITVDMELEPDETLYDDIPQWVYDKIESDRILAEQVKAEDDWRVMEIAFIADQLIAMEDGDPEALPGTEAQWRAYRTATRNWKEGAEHFPDLAHRPVRPA